MRGRGGEKRERESFEKISVFLFFSNRVNTSSFSFSLLICCLLFLLQLRGFFVLFSSRGRRGRNSSRKRSDGGSSAGEDDYLPRGQLRQRASGGDDGDDGDLVHSPAPQQLRQRHIFVKEAAIQTKVQPRGAVGGPAVEAEQGAEGQGSFRRCCSRCRCRCRRCASSSSAAPFAAAAFQSSALEVPPQQGPQRRVLPDPPVLPPDKPPLGTLRRRGRKGRERMRSIL